MEKQQYKTKEELKEELGEKFEDWMYESSKELLTQIDNVKKVLEEKDLDDSEKIKKIKELLKDHY